MLDDLVAALHPLDTPPQPPAWNHAALSDWIGDGPRTPAAVLLAVRDVPEPRVVFTLRRKGLSDHGGEVSFPGGRVEPGDTDALATALRESAEEVGLRAGDVTPLGYLDPLDTISHFRVTPVVARLAPDARLRPAPDEVAEVFEVPLAFLLDAGHLRMITVPFQGRGHQLFEYVDVKPRIWGVTADVMANLLVRMGKLPPRLAMASHTAVADETGEWR